MAVFFKRLLLVLVLLFIIWGSGFLAFSFYATSMKPFDLKQPSSAIVVLTGGEGRIDEGLNLFAARRGLYLFITSVHPDITKDNIRERWTGTTPLPVCCIAIDYEADTTAQNVEMTAKWAQSVKASAGQDLESIRLVTSNYHMPRALTDFKRMLPELTIYPHPVVPSSALTYDRDHLRLLMSEYHKYMFRVVQGLLPQSFQKLWP